MVPIYHTSEQIFRYVYFSILENYLDFVDRFPGATGSLIQNVCTKFGISISHFFSICTFKIFSGKQYWLFSDLLITNKSFAWNWAFLVLGSYLLMDIDSNILSISATMFSTPAICWILGPKSSITSWQHITLRDSLRVAV